MERIWRELFYPRFECLRIEAAPGEEQIPPTALEISILVGVYAKLADQVPDRKLEFVQKQFEIQGIQKDRTKFDAETDTAMKLLESLNT